MYSPMGETKAGKAEPVWIKGKTMIIYKVKTGLDYFTYLKVNRTTTEETQRNFDSCFSGISWGKAPHPAPTYTLIRERTASDFPSLSPGCFTASFRAIEMMSESFPGIFQAVPILVESSDRDYYRIHLVDNAPLDLERSQIKRFRSDGRVMRVKEYAFREEDLDGKTLFCAMVDGTMTGDILATEKFKHFYEKSGLSGIGFVPFLNTDGGDLPPSEVPLNGYTLNEIFLLSLIGPQLKKKYKQHSFLFELSDAFKFLCHCEADGAVQPFDYMSPENYGSILKGMEQAGTVGGMETLKEGADIYFSLDKKNRKLLRDLEFLDGDLSEEGEKILESDARFKNVSKSDIDIYGRGISLIERFPDEMDKAFRIHFADYMESIMEKVRATGILKEKTENPID